MALTQQQIKTVLDCLEHGVSLRKACAEADISSHSVWINACSADAALADQYARARQIGYELLADQIIEISDDSSHDKYLDKDGKLKTDQEVVNRSRLMVDTRKWMLSKMLPKVYGDKLDLTHSGSIKTGADTLSDAELAVIAAQGKPAADKA